MVAAAIEGSRDIYVQHVVREPNGRIAAQSTPATNRNRAGGNIRDNSTPVMNRNMTGGNISEYATPGG